MRKFTPEQAVAAVELQQLVADWCEDLDMNGGSAAHNLFTEDCIVDFGKVSYTGHEAMIKFYAARNERVRTQQKDGIRTQRHGFANLRIYFEGNDFARLKFTTVNYSGEGAPPLMNATTPTIIADSRFECRRQPAGHWLISAFYSTPVFVGNDPFLNANVVK